MNRSQLALAALVAMMMLSPAVMRAQAPPPPPPAPAPPAAPQPPADNANRAALEEKFIKQMSGCTLVGYFSDSNHPDAAPRAEKYVITKVTKGMGDLFVFNARFKMRNGEVNLPLPIPVKWAGDTPVICVTKMGIPGMGTYTARVVIYEGQYSGMWMGTGHGGSLWGKIEPLPKEEVQPAAEDGKQPEGAPKQ